MEAYSPDKLKDFGIILLTGEACGIGMRILFNLTATGKKIVEEFFRVEATCESWNCGTDKDPHVASIMLPLSVLQELWIFCHLRRGTKYVFLGGHVLREQDWTVTHYESIEVTLKHPVKSWVPVALVTDDDEQMKRIQEMKGESFYIAKSYRMSKQPGSGIDNQHGMSGRLS